MTNQEIAQTIVRLSVWIETNRDGGDYVIMSSGDDDLIYRLVEDPRGNLGVSDEEVWPDHPAATIADAGQAFDMIANRPEYIVVRQLVAVARVIKYLAREIQ